MLAAIGFGGDRSFADSVESAGTVEVMHLRCTCLFWRFFDSCEDGASSCVWRLEWQLEESGVCSTLQNFFGSWYFVSSFEVCSDTSELSPQHWFKWVAHHVLFGLVKDNLFGTYGNRNLALWWSLSCRKLKS
ncbi:hypothetical protein CsSME_00000150 [Camellia sinensis var. sinensis]